MPEIGDRASSPDVEVVLAPDLAGAYRLRDVSMVPAEQIGDPDGFPEYGFFVPVWTVRIETDAGEQPRFTDTEEALVECPLVLEQELDGLGTETGEVFVVNQPRKAEGGRWVMDVSQPDSAEAML